MSRSVRGWGAVLLAGALLLGPGSAAAVELIADGEFNASATSRDLRRDTKGQDWYESRRDAKGSRALLMLSKKGIAGNATPKAMIKAHPDLNTYLTQRFADPQKDDFTIRYDILVKEILPDDNRSAFFMIGAEKDGKGGPNSTGAERFVFMGFENAATPGKINLFAREGKAAWEQKKIVARDLDRDRWYTIEATVYPDAGSYEVVVRGVTPKPVEVDAFQAGKKPLSRLTHMSFASWNDGAGTFYVDNVRAWRE